MSKEKLFLQEIICKYHPTFKSSKDLQNVAHTNPNYFNVTSLIEESMAAVGGYEFVDEYGYDFSDLSDSKTVSVNINTGKAEVGNVETKIGALRIVAYNPVINDIAYFYIPADEVKYVKLPCYGKDSHKERVVFTYTKKGDYGWAESYRKSSFKELATAY